MIKLSFFLPSIIYNLLEGERNYDNFQSWGEWVEEKAIYYLAKTWSECFLTEWTLLNEFKDQMMSEIGNGLNSQTNEQFFQRTLSTFFLHNLSTKCLPDFM